MIVDSSALIAIVLREPGWEALAEKLSTSPAGTGAPTLAEAGIVLTAKLGPRGRSLLARVVQEARVAVIPFTDEQPGRERAPHRRLAISSIASGWSATIVRPVMPQSAQTR